MKVLVLTRFGRQGASSRMRSFQYLPWFESASIEYIVSPLFDDVMLLRKYQQGNYSLWSVFATYWRRIHKLMGRHQFDLIWIEKEALPWFPAWFERLLLRDIPYALDFDDAIFHKYDTHRLALVRRIYGRRLDKLMSKACLVVAGNHYLANRAVVAGASRVEIIPTVVDLMRYTPKKTYSLCTKPRIVWIGSPSTVQYLLELAVPLAELAKRQSFVLRVIGGEKFAMPGVDVEVMAWSAETEARAIAECNIGIMPLRDTPWEQGKCAYKLIQYMACGLPTVASPIGTNRDVVIDGETGYFADTSSAWIENLEKLLIDSVLCQRLGTAGRARVEAKYCLQQTAPRLMDLLIDVSRR